jgi:hypothetical protein
MMSMRLSQKYPSIGPEGGSAPNARVERSDKTRGPLDPDHWDLQARRLVVVELRDAVCALLNQWVWEKALPLDEQSHNGSAKYR